MCHRRNLPPERHILHHQTFLVPWDLSTYIFWFLWWNQCESINIPFIVWMGIIVIAGTFWIDLRLSKLVYITHVTLMFWWSISKLKYTNTSTMAKWCPNLEGSKKPESFRIVPTETSQHCWSEEHILKHPFHTLRWSPRGPPHCLVTPQAGWGGHPNQKWPATFSKHGFFWVNDFFWT